MSSQSKTFGTVPKIAENLRKELKSTKQKKGKKTILLFAYNGTGKTRLSMEFKDQGKNTKKLTSNSETLTANGEELVYTKSDTLYFNAFTEDLFSWDNDLENDRERKLILNTKSKFFEILINKGFDIENSIRKHLSLYANFEFKIIEEKEEEKDKPIIKSIIFWNKADDINQNPIKISRGEENIFIWCFFLAILDLAMDKKIDIYNWVKYIYIDDPVSSLDENNVVAVAHHLAQLLKNKNNPLKTVISSHHTLFFNVLYNEFSSEKGKKSYFLSKDKEAQTYTLKDTSDTPFFYHIAMLEELKEVSETKNIYTYHFQMLRIILEKTAGFHGYKNFSDCITKDENDEDQLYARQINVLNHGKYSIYEPTEMLQENKDMFCKILNDFLKNYKFNIKVFSSLENEAEAKKQ